MEFPFTEISFDRGWTRWTDIDQRSCDILASSVFPHFFFLFIFLLFPLPLPPLLSLSFFLITIARSVLFVPTMHNGARAAHVCSSSGGILIANRDYRAERYYAYIFNGQGSLRLVSRPRARPLGGGRETKNGEIETPRFTPRSRRDVRGGGVRLRQPEYERYTRVPCHRFLCPGYHLLFCTYS